MPDMTITQTVTEDDFRKAYATHYSTYLWTRYRPWFGAAMVAFGVYIITSQPAHQLSVAIMFLMLGGYLFAAKWIYVARLVHISKRAGRLPAAMQVEISDHGPLKVSADGERTELDPKRLFGVKVADFGVLIYLQRNMFFLLKKDAIEQAGGLDLLVSILNEHGLRRIK